MDINVIAQLSIGLAAAVLILREVFTFLSSRNVQDKAKLLEKIERVMDENKESIRNIEKMTDSLYEWHNVADENGMKVWYIPRELSRALVKFAENSRVQTAVIQQLIEEVRSLRHG